MAIPETQMNVWSHQGATVTAKLTADSIKNAINTSDGWSRYINFEVYLQGSYKNDTNIRGDSDIDVVVQLNSTFYSNLSDDQKRTLHLTPASYSWTDFKVDVLRTLRVYYGADSVIDGNKTLKIKANNGRLPADVVVCSQYRKFKSVNTEDHVKGMCFWANGSQIINYPKIHYDNGVTKHQNTSQWYKPVVRIFKNMRDSVSGDASPSYFIECLIYNTPYSKFGINYQTSFCNVVNWLNEANLDDFICNNGQDKLFGSAPGQWNTGDARSFIKKVIYLWNNW